MTSTSLAAPASFPVQLLPQSDFDQLREWLIQFGYNGINLKDHLHLKQKSDSEIDVALNINNLTPATTLLVSLFLQGKSVTFALMAETLGSHALELLSRFGLLQSNSAGDRIAATVALYPTHGLYIISDRWCGIDGGPHTPPTDVVYPAILGTTRGFLNMIPGSPCNRFLEVCAGTGIAALLAACNGVAQSWAFDIAERSVHFAEFNRRLNGIDNVIVRQGDLYSPANGQTFDRIVAHPPYVPVLEPKFVFYDGGQDGEQITRRLVQELPRVLEENGLFVCVSLGSDRKGLSFEQRIRSFLGPSHEEYDVALFVRSEMEPAVQALNDVVRGRGSIEHVQRWREVLRELQIVSFVFGGIYICRHGRRRKGYTLRLTMGDTAGLPEIGAAMDWARTVAEERSTDALRSSILRSRPGCRVDATYAMKNNRWVLDHQKILIDEPFKMQVDAPGWVARVLELCDGTATGDAVFQMLKGEDILTADSSFTEFAGLLAMLVSGGFLTVGD